MNDNKTKLRVKLGAAEIEYEGNEGFLKDEVMPQISKMLEMVESRAELQKSTSATPLLVEQSPAGVNQSPAPGMTTNTIAAILDAKSASDLALAALAKLTIVDGAPSASRQDILDEMRTAPTFFKQSFVNNHSNTMKAILKSDDVRLVAPDKYGFSNKFRTEILKKLEEAE